MRGAGLSPFEVDGALARTVADAAILLSAMVATDARDPTRYPGDPPDFASWAVAGDLRGLTLSASPALAATAVAAGLQRAVDALRHAGAAVTDEAPLTAEPSALLSTVTAAGAALGYGELAAQRTHDLSDYARRSLMRGAALTGTAVAAAYAEINRFAWMMESFFERHDGLVLPTTATTAPVSLVARAHSRFPGAVQCVGKDGL